MENKTIIDGIDVSGCTRYCADTGKCTAFKSQYLCSERNNCYTKRILKKNKTISILKEKLQVKEQECDQLKQNLTEIKEIAEREVKHAPDGETFARPEIKQILQKISEVK